jgi:hypothetical protein
LVAKEETGKLNNDTMELEVDMATWSLRAPHDIELMVKEGFTILVKLIGPDYQLIHVLSFEPKIPAEHQ